jgi:hypothetical protein
VSGTQLQLLGGSFRSCLTEIEAKDSDPRKLMVRNRKVYNSLE